MNIFILNEPEPVNSVTHWRMYDPFSKMEKQHGMTIRKNQGSLTPWDFLWPDVVIAFRCTTETQYKVLNAFKKRGCKIVVDYDDDFMNIPIYHDAYFSLYAFHNYFKECVSLADTVWVSTPTLASVIATIANSPIVVVPNAVSIEAIEKASFNDSGKKIMWRGSSAQRHDIKIKNYKSVAAQATDFIWFGHIPKDHQIDGVNVSYIPPVSAWEYFDLLEQIRPNVIWKPLDDTPFNRAKSNIAWIEATLCGGVCLTSLDTSEWTYALKGDIIEWDNKLTWEASIKEVMDKYTLEAANNLRLNSINNL